MYFFSLKAIREFIPLTVAQPRVEKSPKIASPQIGTPLQKRVLCVLLEMRLRVKRHPSRCYVVQSFAGKLAQAWGQGDGCLKTPSLDYYRFVEGFDFWGKQMTIKDTTYRREGHHRAWFFFNQAPHTIKP
jgi:hypothetical protein